MKDLAQIVLQTLATLNSLEKAKDRFIEITSDGQISDDEMHDFVRIEEGIRNIGLAADSLSLWIEQMMASGKIDREKLEEARKELENKE